jgi:hypothetical protein
LLRGCAARGNEKRHPAITAQDALRKVGTAIGPLGDADYGHFAPERLMQVRTETGTPVFVSVDVAIHDDRFERVGYKLEDLQQSRKFTLEEVTRTVRLHILDLEDVLTDRIGCVPGPGYDAGNASASSHVVVLGVKQSDRAHVANIAVQLECVTPNGSVAPTLC